LQSLNLKHGDMLYLIYLSEPPKSTSSTSQASNAKANGKPNGTSKGDEDEEEGKKPFALTSRCQHGPRGRCLHCDGIAPGVTPKVNNSCNHGPNATCIHCSKYVQDKNAK